MEEKRLEIEPKTVEPIVERRKGRGAWIFWFALFLGMALGISGTILLPKWGSDYLPAGLITEEVIEGRVIDKTMEPERLLLKIDSDRGIVLAAFTDLRPELCMLVDIGDTVILGFRGNEPFLQDPRIQRVVKPQPAEGLPSCDEIPPPPIPEPKKASGSRES